MSLLQRIRQNREKRMKLVHILSGVIILIHAFEKYDSGHHSYIYFAIAGIIFLLVALLHHQIARHAPWIDGVFFLIEASLSFTIAYEYFHAGKKGLPVCYAIMGAAQVFLAFYRGHKAAKKHRQHHTASHSIASEPTNNN